MEAGRGLLGKQVLPTGDMARDAQVLGVVASSGDAPLRSPSAAAAATDTLALTHLLMLTDQTRFSIRSNDLCARPSAGPQSGLGSAGRPA